MRYVIGWFLIAAPFLTMIIIEWHRNGWRSALGLVALVFVTIVAVLIGIHLVVN